MIRRGRRKCGCSDKGAFLGYLQRFWVQGRGIWLQRGIAADTVWGLQGGVAKRPKASVCKTDIRGFESHRRLTSNTSAQVIRPQLISQIPDTSYLIPDNSRAIPFENRVSSIENRFVPLHSVNRIDAVFLCKGQLEDVGLFCRFGALWHLGGGAAACELF